MSLFGVQIFVIIFCWFTDSFFIATSNTKYIFKIVRIEFVIKIVCSLIAVQFGLVYLVGINIIISFSMIYVRYKYFTSIVKVSFSQVFKQVLPSICVGILMYAAVSVYLNYFTDVINNEYLLLVTFSFLLLGLTRTTLRPRSSGIKMATDQSNANAKTTPAAAFMPLSEFMVNN